MKCVVLLWVHLIVSLVKLAGPCGARGLLAETLLLEHQLLVVNRARRRATNLTFFDRLFLGLGCLLIHPGRIRRIAVVVSPATLFRFHRALMKRKYRRLFSSSSSRRKPGPKGKADRYHTQRMSRPHVVLERGCSGTQARRFCELLQSRADT